MDYTCRTKTLQSLNKGMEKGTILLSHKLQRPEGQWTKRQKTDLIDSLLRKYPINPSYSIKENGVLSVIDGVQRLSCVRDFLANKFSLSKSMEPVMVNGEEKSLAGLRFKKLDEDTKDAILSAELQLYELTECTEKDVREMFRRQNAGKPLNGKQLRIVHESDAFSDAIYSLALHPFMNKLMTKTQRKNGTDRDIIIQTLMLIETGQNDNFTSFRTKDIDTFVREHSEDCIAKIAVLKEVMDNFDTSFDAIKVPVTSIPMVLYGGYRVVKEQKSFDRYTDLVSEFLNEYDSNEEYKKFVQSGTSSSENVSGRLAYWKSMVDTI